LKKTKRSKERMVPMHPNLTKILVDYCMALKIIGCPNRYLFENQENGKPISERRVRYLFDRLLNETEIELPGRQKHERGPCLHCLRHRFAIDSFIQAEQNRQCLDDAVPYLSIYLGHDSLEETQKYLKFSAELYPGALDNFASFAADIFPEVTYENQDF
jgi:integrase